jgi:PAS domain S-box-containing protein
VENRDIAALHLAALVASADDAIVSKDLQGTILSWNPAAERMFGWTAEEVIGRSIKIIIPEECLPEEDYVLSRVRQGLGVDHYETVRQRKDKSRIDVSLTVSPIRTADGVIIGASKIARDITEQKRLRQSAEEASRLKDEFLAVLSHELRTPLNTVLGYARLLRQEDFALSSERREKALEVLERNADVLGKLVNDVLDTSRVVTGKLRLKLEKFPLDKVVRDAVETLQPAADAKGIALQTGLGERMEIQGDPDRMLQVTWNLLSNAVKFTPSGGRISVRLERSGGHITLRVADTGIGITPEQMPMIFQRFWQGDPGLMREHGGLGIGLALVRHLVELHGGSISASSDGLNRGATFTVTLPAVASVLTMSQARRA